MAIKIEMKDGHVPPKCMQLLLDLASHRDCCVPCVIAHTQELDFNSYCDEGKALIKELLEQPEVSDADK